MAIHSATDSGESPAMDKQPFPVIRSRADTQSAQFAANRSQNLAQLEKLAAALAKANQGGGDQYNQRHLAAGKLLPRQRVELLLDRDGYFLEVCGLAGHGVSGQTSGAGVVGGVGLVSGVECVITASEATVKGGAVTELGAMKTGRLAEIAEK